MKSTDIIQPKAITAPLAYEGARFDIPETSTVDGKATVVDGFPTITMKALKDGGLPPRGEDCNGMFYLSTDQRVYLQNGGIITFNQEVSNAIGGYPTGAILDYINETGAYGKVRSLIDDNTNNFVTNPALIDGTNWELLGTNAAGLANTDLSNLTPAGETRFNNKANTSLSNLTSEGEKHFLNYGQVTNCALEIPENVTVDLAAGNATVRKGSIAVFPNGFESDGKTPRFDHVIFPQDVQSGTGGAATNSRSQMARRLANGNLGLGPAYVTQNIYSGPTEPTATLAQVWYDTTSNLIKHRNSSSEAWTSGISFPLFEGAYATATGFTSINNVFNGMGYIGSTVWVDKGVKGLAPNYRNPDGTLKNNEISVKSVRTLTLSVNRINATLYVSPNSLTFGTGFTYNPTMNILEHSDGTNPIAFGISGFDSDETGRITKWEPHQAVNLACLQSPTFIGKPTVPTPSSNDNSTRIANTAFVNLLLNIFQQKQLACDIGNSYAIFYTNATKTTPVIHVEWGYTNFKGTGTSITFSKRFTVSNTIVFGAVAAASAHTTGVTVDSSSLTSFNAHGWQETKNSDQNAFWVAVGK